MDDTKKKEVIAKLPVDNSGKSGMVLANIDGKWVWVTIEEAAKRRDGRNKESKGGK